jgi:hypothetical protein
MTSDPVFATVAGKHLCHAVATGLHSLPPRERQVLELRFGFLGRPFTVGETSAIVGVSKAYVYVLLEKARTRLRQSITKSAIFPGEPWDGIVLPRIPATFDQGLLSDKIADLPREMEQRRLDRAQKQRKEARILNRMRGRLSQILRWNIYDGIPPVVREGCWYMVKVETPEGQRCFRAILGQDLAAWLSRDRERRLKEEEENV